MPNSLVTLITNYLQTLNNNSLKITIDQLSNGLGFEYILCKMGFKPQLHLSNTFLQKFHNLKMIYDTITQQAIKYRLYNVLEQNIDLVDIVKNKNTDYICRLFLCCQAVALKGANNQYFIQKMLELSEQDQSLLINNIKDLMQKKQQKSESAILLHKITQLEHQNLQLQKIIESEVNTSNQYYISIEQLKKKILSYQQILQNQQNLILSPKYSSQFSERKSFTPKRLTSQSFDQYQLQISNLQYQLDVFKNNQSQLLQYKNKYQQMTNKNNQLASNSIIIEKQKQIDNMYDLLIQKQKNIQKLRQHIKNMNDKNQQLHNTSIADKIHIQVQEVKIKQLQKQIQSIKHYEYQEKVVQREALSEICPGINHQIDSLRQQNQNLLENMNKTTNKMQTIQRQLQRFKRQNHRLGGLERQNKKLEQILMDYSNARGEQNDVLVGCLYQLRTKFNKQMVEEIRRERKGRQLKARYD